MIAEEGLATLIGEFDIDWRPEVAGPSNLVSGALKV
jgi:hypothetical protein